MLNLLIFIFYSFIILLSVIGYGFIFVNFFFKKKKDIEISLIGIFGLFVIFLLSSFTHLFMSHYYFHNFFIIIIGLIFFYLNKQDIRKDHLQILFFVFIILFSGFLITKTNEDFPYYHLPISLQFVYNNLQFGLGNLSVAYNHFSSIFLINSIFYLPITKHFLFNLVNFLFQIFFFTQLIILFINKGKLSIFSLVLIGITACVFILKFYRLAEYGVDMPGQLLVTLSIILLSIIIFQNENEKLKIQYFFISLLLIIFAVTTKLIYSIYFIIPIITGLSLFGYKKLLTILINYKFLFLVFLSTLIFVFYNFSSSGCLVYPVHKTCMFYELDWTLKKDTILHLNLHYEAWAKAGKGAGYELDELQNYVNNFNWVSNWLKEYFFTKFSDFILVVLTISLIVYLLSSKKNKVKHFSKKNNFNFLLLYSTILIVFLIWFSNFPTLRYAGYSISFFLIILPICFFISKYKINNEKKYFYRLKIFFVICLVIFNIRNFERINTKLELNEHSSYNFTNFPFYWTKNLNYSRKNINNYEISFLKSKDHCWDVKPVCVKRPNIGIRMSNGFIFYYVDNEK